MQDELFFDQFMQASSLDRYSVREFASQLSSYDNEQSVQRNLVYPAVSIPLPKVKTKLDAIAKNRCSKRIFGSKKLSLKDLSAVLQSLRAWHGLDYRSYGAAGSLYAVETFAVAYGVKDSSPQVLYYDAENHGYIEVTPAPDWQDVVPRLNIEVEGEPQVLLLFVVYPDRVTVKYGERGGRFVLYEVGMALQQVSLAVAERKLHGVAVGGTFDEYWRKILELDARAQIASGYLIGS